jgi:hypothetical protein
MRPPSLMVRAKDLFALCLVCLCLASIPLALVALGVAVLLGYFG